MISENFVLTTLSNNPEYFDEVLNLIEEEFHYNDSFSFEKDFAPLMNPLNFEHCYLYIDRFTNKVAAHLAICQRFLVKNEAVIKVALVGGIATHKNFRRRHLFKSLMDHALEENRGCGLFILWSDLENIYEKFNFHRTGGLIETGTRIFSSSERPKGYEKNKFSSLSDDEFDSLVELYSNFNEKKFFTLKREEKDWSIIREMSSIDLYVRKNLQGKICRYFCVNKGRDLTNIIHEVGALDNNEYAGLIKDLETYKLWMPETEGGHFKSRDIFYTAFFRIGSIAEFNHFLDKASDGLLKITNHNTELIHFDFKGEKFEVSHKDFLQYLFGPKPLVEFVSFGLSLYVAGADSI